MKAPRATLDAETRSHLDLRKVGGYRYAMDPSTEVLVWAYRLPHWESGRTELWTPEYPELGITQQGGDFDALFELFEWAANGGLVECHNASFDRNIWHYIMVPRYGWPEIPLTQWRCSAAQAAAVALPRGLDDALAAMRLALRKDEEGSKVMKKMTKPRKPRKAEREAWQTQHGETPMGVLYHENHHLLEQLYEYVRQDVLAEEGLSYVLPDLSPDELLVYQVDQIINDRGFCVDMEGVRTALKLRTGEAAMLNAQLADITNGAVPRASLRGKLTNWLAGEGIVLEDTQAATIDALLDSWPESGSEMACCALETVRKLGRSASTSKYEAMAKYASPVDGRVRGGLLYHGAGTGRWAGAGVQPQNFTKGSLKARDGEDPDAFVNRLWRDIKTEDADYLRMTYDAPVTDVLSHGLRSAIVPSPGRELFVADYAGIEARVLVWLAGDDETCQKFADGVDLYVEMAADIYKRPVTKADKQERQLGKCVVLACGFGQGWKKFISTAANPPYFLTIDEVFSQQAIAAYREKNWRVVDMWKAQDEAAIRAVQTKQEVECGKVCWYQHGVFLYVELPSGRRISYPFPSASLAETPWGAEKMSLQFKGVDTKTRQWVTQRAYGGLLVENIVQGVARDLMALALLRLEAHPTYDPVLSVHDEAIAEAVIGAGDVHEFERIIAEVPDWAEGLPIAAESWVGTRYRK